MDPNTTYRSPLIEHERATDFTGPRPATHSLYAGRSPYAIDSAKRLNLIVSTELQRFRCLETGKAGSLAELALSLEQGAEDQKGERSAS